MKETICEEIKNKESKENIKKELNKNLPDKYRIDSGDFGIFYIDKKSIWFYFNSGGKCAKIFWESKSKIIVYDKNLYEILKTFGKKYEYEYLTKCWEGCDEK